jgi:hypothetical protein
MLRVVDHVATHFTQVGDCIADHREVFFGRYTKHFSHMKIRRLADDCDDGRLRLDERFHAGVIRRQHTAAARHAECAQPRMLQRLFRNPLKKFGVLRI